MSLAIERELIPEKFRKDCGCEGCSFALRLAAEQFGSYRRPSQDQEPAVRDGATKPDQKPISRRPQTKKDQKQPSIAQLTARWRRDKLFFDAGRFAAGARDEDASKAFAERARLGAR